MLLLLTKIHLSRKLIDIYVAIIFLFEKKKIIIQLLILYLKIDAYSYKKNIGYFPRTVFFMPYDVTGIVFNYNGSADFKILH